VSIPSKYQRGEIWQADLGTDGSLPVLILSTDALSNLPIRLVVPLQPWDERFTDCIWIYRLKGDWPQQLGTPHAADLLLLRSIATSQLRRKIGRVSATTMDEIVTALAIIVDYNPSTTP
jgi:mRNA interferase MazF